MEISDRSPESFILDIMDGQKRERRISGRESQTSTDQTIFPSSPFFPTFRIVCINDCHCSDSIEISDV